jgi:hypothetical protein
MDREQLDAAEKGMVSQAGAAIAMSRAPTAAGFDTVNMTRNATNKTVIVSIPTSVDGVENGSYEKTGAYPEARPGLFQNKTAPVIQFQGLEEVEIGDSALLPKSESGNVHVGMASEQQATGAIGEPGNQNHG